jgi:hypothetical protein
MCRTCMFSYVEFVYMLLKLHQRMHVCVLLRDVVPVVKIVKAHISYTYIRRLIDKPVELYSRMYLTNMCNTCVSFHACMSFLFVDFHGV